MEINPRLVLSLRTVRMFGCLGNHIDHDLRRGRDTLHLALHGVSAPSDVCATAMGPATMSRELRLASGRFTLLVSHKGTTDRLILEASDTMTVVTGLDSTRVEADERPRWRFPRNSFILKCSDQGSGFCEDIYAHSVKARHERPRQSQPRVTDTPPCETNSTPESR